MNLLENDIEIEDMPEVLHRGVNVEIFAGPLTGISSELIDFARKKRVILRFNEIRKSVIISFPMNLLRVVS
jgi:hypothetical protein